MLAGRQVGRPVHNKLVSIIPTGSVPKQVEEESPGGYGTWQTYP